METLHYSRGASNSASREPVVEWHCGMGAGPGFASGDDGDEVEEMEQKWDAAHRYMQRAKGQGKDRGQGKGKGKAVGKGKGKI